MTITNEYLHDSQVKWVKDAKSSSYINVQESVKGITRRQITGTEILFLVLADEHVCLWMHNLFTILRKANPWVCMN